MNKTPLLEFVYNRKKTAATNREAAVELRITFERRQKYMTTGIKVLTKQWHKGTIVKRLDDLQMNQTMEKLMTDVHQIILEMLDSGHIDIYAIPDKLRRMKEGNITFIKFCLKRAEIRKMNKAEDSQERYDRFLKFVGLSLYFHHFVSLEVIVLSQFYILTAILDTDEQLLVAH